MVAATARRNTGFTGLRSLDASRDLAGVAVVIEEAFRGEMDSVGARAVHAMRLMGMLGPFTWWLDQLVPPGEGFSPGPGYVWAEDGRIVGNATLSRISTFGRGWVIGNVAVLPDYRGHGIARALMEACINRVREEGGLWVALQVREDNEPAYRLYTNLGFQSTGAGVQLRREPQPLSGLAPSPGALQLRRPRSNESGVMYALAQQVTPQGLLWAESLRESDFSLSWDKGFDLWLSGRRERWWLAEAAGQVVGVCEAETFSHRGDESRLRLWTQAGSGAAALLLAAALRERGVGAASRPTLVTHPAQDTDTLNVLALSGFRPLRTLVHMKLDLRAPAKSRE